MILKEDTFILMVINLLDIGLYSNMDPLMVLSTKNPTLYIKRVIFFTVNFFTCPFLSVAH